MTAAIPRHAFMAGNTYFCLLCRPMRREKDHPVHYRQGEMVDTRPDNPRPCCVLCGTWVCDNVSECSGYILYKANRASRQLCPHCGHALGHFEAIRHMRPMHLERRPVTRYSLEPLLLRLRLTRAH